MNKVRKFLEGKVINFQEYVCKAEIRPYCSGRIYMVLNDIEDGIQVARVTLDIASVPVIDDMIIVKSYRENEGMYEALLNAGIIKECGRKISVGNDFGLICFLNLD